MKPSLSFVAFPIRLLRVVLVAAGALALTPTAADACSCVARDLKDPDAFAEAVRAEFQNSAAVFEGDVIARGRFTATFRVRRVWAGDVGAVLTLDNGSSPTVDGTILVQGCTSDFHGSTGHTYIVFATYHTGGRMSAQRCGFTSRKEHAGRIEEVLDRIRRPVEPTGPLVQAPELGHVLSDLEKRLQPVAAWRDRATLTLQKHAGTPLGDREFLRLRQELKAIVLELASVLDTSSFQALIWPDGAVGQALRRVAQGSERPPASDVAKADVIVSFLKERGVWTQRAEGDTYFHVHEQALLEGFGPLVSEEIRRFLQLWVDEQVRPTAEDASIQITLDDLEERILATERYLQDFPESIVADPVRTRHSWYLSLYLGGTSNTEAFDHRTGVIKPELWERFQAYSVAHPGNASGRIVARYLALLQGTGFMRTPETRRFVDQIRGDLRLMRY